MKFPIFVFFLCLLSITLRAEVTVTDDSSASARGLSAAHALAAEGSYAQALEIYQSIDSSALTSEQQDTLTYLMADATWRNLASTRQTDSMLIQRQRDILIELAGKLQRAEASARPPQLWAEVQESLGDSYWLNSNERNWGQAWPHYQKALDWWAASTDIDAAREHYLTIVFRAANPESGWPRNYQYGRWGADVPISFLENAVTISRAQGDKAQAHYLLGMAYFRQNGAFAEQQVNVNLQAAIDLGQRTAWYDNALYQYAQWQEQRGSSRYDENGNWVVEPNFEAALKLYRQYLSEFKEGEAFYWRQAQQRIEQITAKELYVNVPYNFLPGAAVSFQVSTRNVDGLVIEVFTVKRNELRFPGSEPDDVSTNWWERIPLGSKKPVWTDKGQDAQAYVRASHEVRLPQGLSAGLYVVRASAEGQTSYSWLLVTDAALVTKIDAAGLHVWAIDAQSGESLAGAKLTAWLNRTQRNARTWQSVSGETDDDGLATLKVPAGTDYWQGLLFADTERGPVVMSYGWSRNSGDTGQWRVYAFTDRPAYRPEDTVHWKFSARVQKSLAAYSVPSGETLHWRIVDARGGEAAKGDAMLNEYGSAWGELALTQDMPLGMYRIEFRYNGNWVGSEQLFRLEEYKLPEFKVAVTTKGVDGEPQTAFRLGDRVEVAVQADYYFGGTVNNANVEVVVRQKPYVPGWHPIIPYSWLYTSQPQVRGRGGFGGYYGPGQEVQREILKTDGAGRATFAIQTPAGNRQNLEYTVEARVVDSSRREIIGTGSIRVTRQPYFVHLTPERQLYRPGETVSIAVKSLNANDDPVSTSGHLRLTREEWQEIWINPRGEEITGKEYRRRLNSQGLFSKRFEPHDWEKHREGYEVEEIETQSVTTNADGEATFTYTIPKSGYYKLAWFSQADDGYPIRADTAIWCADDASVSIGYHGDLKLIFDKDAFRSGQSAPVMLTTPAPGRTVWFTVETDGILESRVIEMEGTVKLIQLDVTDAWVPNVFLGAAMFQGYQLYQDMQEAIVPPADQFIDVTIIPSADLYQPRDTGTFTIETRDADGSPIAAEVALSLFDESVLYIQSMIAPDPREFFYGQKRYNAVQTASSAFERGFWTPEQEKKQAEGRARASVGGAANELSSVDNFAPQAVMAASAPMAESRMMAKGAMMDQEAGDGAAPDGAAVVVRNDFRATAFWQPNIMTGPDGTAQVEVTFPDSLTTWKAEAWALALSGKVGQGSTQVKTKIPLIARLQMPRFLVTGDSVTLSGVINNNTDEDMTVEVSLVQDGEALQIGSVSQSVIVPAQGEARADFTAKALTPGAPKLTLTAKGTQYADAMALELPVFEHGIDKFLAQSGKFVGDSLTVTLDMPEFRAEGARFEIVATPSLAATMLDALPYLVQYPYGCVEQTMSRFLPAVIVTKTLQDLGLSEEDVVERAFGGIEGREPGQGADSLYDLKQMVSDGLDRLYDFQHGDGGWGWWKGGDSDPFMSAYVVWGLTLCEQSGLSLRSGVLERGREFLDKRLVEAEAQPDLAAWMLHALSTRFEGYIDPAPSRFEVKAFGELWKAKDSLNAYTRALLTLSAVNLGFEDEAATLARNLENGVIVDTAPQSSIFAGNNPGNSAELATAHWGSDGIFYRWSEGGVEATAFVVKALLAVKSHRELTDQAVNWLVQNRRGAQWSNTRDTAITILALNAYLKVSGELEEGIDYAIELNGQTVATESIAAGQGPLAPSRFTVDVSKLRVGANVIRFIRTHGEAPLYFSARADFFTLEDPIAPAGNVVFVQRDFYRIRPVSTLLDGYAEEKTRIESGAEIQSGDRVEVVLVVQAKNNLEYLVFEDLKAAGFEATALQSGASLYAREVRVLPDGNGNIALPADDAQDRYTGRERWVYQELRDRKIASFVDKLPEGYWELRYTLRAETPGSFSALPVLGHAMYVPEIRANSAEFKVTVEDS